MARPPSPNASGKPVHRPAYTGRSLQGQTGLAAFHAARGGRTRSEPDQSGANPRKVDRTTIVDSTAVRRLGPLAAAAGRDPDQEQRGQAGGAGQKAGELEDGQRAASRNG